jgi:hypothetical protein
MTAQRNAGLIPQELVPLCEMHQLGGINTEKTIRENFVSGFIGALQRCAVDSYGSMHCIASFNNARSSQRCNIRSQ